MMKPAQGRYAEYVMSRGLAWVRWKLTRFPERIYRLLRRAYRRRWAQPEVSAYLGMGVRIIGEDMGRHLPVGSVGVVTRSELREDWEGDRTYTIEFYAENVTLSAGLPCRRHFELFTPETPLTGTALILSTDVLIARYGPFRAHVWRAADNQGVRYVIVTREDEQGGTTATLSDLAHVDVADPEGALWNAATLAGYHFNRHAANTDEPLIPAGPTVDELVNGYRRPGSSHD